MYCSLELFQKPNPPQLGAQRPDWRKQLYMRGKMTTGIWNLTDAHANVFCDFPLNTPGNTMAVPMWIIILMTFMFQIAANEIDAVRKLFTFQVKHTGTCLKWNCFQMQLNMVRVRFILRHEREPQHIISTHIGNNDRNTWSDSYIFNAEVKVSWN